MCADPTASNLQETTPTTGALHFAEHLTEKHATSTQDVDASLEVLHAHKGEWAQLPIAERLDLLDQVREDLLLIQQDWIASEMKAKGLKPRTFPVAEEWTILAQVFRAIRQIERTLSRIEASEPVVSSDRIHQGPRDRVVLRTFPMTLWDQAVFLNVTGDVWIQPGVSAEEALTGKVARYADPAYSGKVSFVLGGGNASMIPISDTLHKLFVDLQVVILKMNPVNANVGPCIERALRCMIERGFVALAYGGADIGAYITNHPLVEEIHMTGSDKTYEAIVFGGGEEGRRRKQERKPINTKPFTAELGNVSPVIVVPGPWKPSDIDEYAKHIASWMTVNAGFACLTPRVIIQHKSWESREDLTQAIRADLAKYPNRKAYYPGAFEIHKDFLEEHPEALQLGSPGEGQLPWTIFPDLDPTNTDDICFRREGFGGLTGELSLEAESVEEYVSKAVKFANNNLWGSLCATLVVHPRSMRDPRVRAAIEKAIEELQYGTVSLNMLAYYSSYFGVCPWGAIPGHDIYDIQSGIGRNVNFAMLDKVEKVVVRAPFRRLDPLTIRAKRAHIFAKKLAGFEAKPSIVKLVGVLWSALRS
jgi:acyl-CoA reductase-like NAD-dependent aldehyde dehydrogenase